MSYHFHRRVFHGILQSCKKKKPFSLLFSQCALGFDGNDTDAPNHLFQAL